MIAALTALLGAALYAAAGYGGARAAEVMIPRLHRFEDGPEPRDVHIWWLVGGAALLGLIVGAKLAPLPDLLVFAFLTCALAAIWYCDVRTGIVPDLFTLVPLAVGAIIALFRHEYWPLLSALVVGLPFAGAALLSRGRGMGWGDAKLAALGGLVLGMLSGTFLFGIASLAAVIVSAIRNRSKPEPVAFAPYLVAAIGVGIALSVR